MSAGTRAFVFPLIGVGLIVFGIASYFNSADLQSLEATGQRAEAWVVGSRTHETRRSSSSSSGSRKRTDYYITVRFQTPDGTSIRDEREVSSTVYRKYQHASLDTPAATQVVYDPANTSKWYEINDLSSKGSSSGNSALFLPLIGLVLIGVGGFSFYQWRNRSTAPAGPMPGYPPPPPPRPHPGGNDHVLYDANNRK